MMIAFGADFPEPTALLQRMDAVSHGHANLDDENLWLAGNMEHVRREVGTTRPWSRLVDAYDDISSEVAHVRFDKLMPDWNSVDPAEAVMELSPIRTVFPIHEAATKIGISIIALLKQQGLNENMALATFLLRSLVNNRTSEFLIYEVDAQSDRPLYLRIETFKDLRPYELYRSFISEGEFDPRLAQWAKQHLGSCFEGTVPKRPQ